MSKIVLHILSFILLCALFVAQTGVLISKHFCKLKGSTSSFFKKSSNTCCCSSYCYNKKHFSKQTCSLEPPPCCAENSKYYKLHTDFLQNLIPHFILIVSLPLLFSFETIFLAYPSENLLLPTQFANPPPSKLHGKKLLSFVCSYLI